MEEQKSQQSVDKKGPMEVFISGPNVLYTFVKKGTTIRLFGEWHEREKTCDDVEARRSNRIMNILQYLEKELAESKIDLYLEAPIIHLQDKELIKLFNDSLENFNKGQLMIKKLKEERLRKTNPLYVYKLESPPFLTLTRDALKWCINPNKRDKCKYKNSRVHSTDLRPFYRISEISEKLRNITKNDEWKQFQKEYENDIEILSKINDCEDYANYILELAKIKIGNKYPIEKQIKKSEINLERLKDIIETVCKERQAIKWVKKYVDWFSKPIPYSDIDKNQRAQELLDVTQNQLTIIHDIYTFLRMLRPFDDKPQENIIFYGGKEHADTLAIMLKLEGFTQIKNHSRTWNRNCLSIRE